MSDCPLQRLENGTLYCPDCGYQSRRTFDAASPLPSRHCGREIPAIQPIQPPAPGPGDFLRSAIKRWLGESYLAQCGCENRVAQMNVWGPGGCRTNITTIIDWLWEESQKRDWRFQGGWWMERATNATRALRRWPRSYEWMMRTAIGWFVLLAAIRPAEKEASATS